MFSIIIQLFKPKKCHWSNRDYDVPVDFLGVSGEFCGVKFAKVRYEGKESYVPYNELVWK